MLLYRELTATRANTLNTSTCPVLRASLAVVPILLLARTSLKPNLQGHSSPRCGVSGTGDMFLLLGTARSLASASRRSRRATRSLFYYHGDCPTGASAWLRQATCFLVHQHCTVARSRFSVVVTGDTSSLHYTVVRSRLSAVTTDDYCLLPTDTAASLRPLAEFRATCLYL